MDETYIICPKCGEMNDSISIDCHKCGVIFSKYYGILAKDETDEGKRAELLKMKEEEEAKAEALRKQREEEEAKAEELRKKKLEEAKAEELRKKKLEEAKAEELRKQKEEEAKTEALRKQQEEEAKAEELRKQKEEEEAKAEALRKQEQEAKAEALRKQQEEEAKELQKRINDIIDVLKPKMKIKDILKKYEEETIGINYDSSTEFKGANLVKVGDDIFSILIMDKKLMKSFPLRNIMSITEGVNGVSIDNMEGRPPFPIIIEVYHPAL